MKFDEIEEQEKLTKETNSKKNHGGVLGREHDYVQGSNLINSGNETNTPSFDLRFR